MLFVSEETLAEVRDVFFRPNVLAKLPDANEEQIAGFIEEVIRISTFVDSVPKTFKRDPKDEMIIDLAVICEADYIVSRDKDLLDLMTDHEVIPSCVKQDYFCCGWTQINADFNCFICVLRVNPRLIFSHFFEQPGIKIKFVFIRVHSRAKFFSNYCSSGRSFVFPRSSLPNLPFGNHEGIESISEMRQPIMPITSATVSAPSQTQSDLIVSPGW